MDKYKGIYRIVFDFQQKWLEHGEMSPDDWGACAEESMDIVNKDPANIFLCDLMAAVYNELVRRLHKKEDVK